MGVAAVLLLTSFVPANEPSANNSIIPATGNQGADSGGPSQKIETPGGLSGNSAERRTPNSTTSKSAHPPHKLPLLVDKQTTYILKPLRADGYPDYFAALNDHCGGPATPADNAAVLVIQAFGPETVPAEIRGDYFKLLGIKILPPSGNYFVRSQEMVERWIKGTSPPPEADQEDTLQGQFAAAGEQPWAPDEYPMVAEWLSINAEPLRLIAEASSRPHFYEPILPSSQNLPALCSVALPLEQSLGEITLALEARAMLRAKAGKIEAACDDLLTCHRCLRLMASMLIGQYALGTRTAEIELCQTELKLLHYCRPSVKQVERMRTGWATLPPTSSLVNRIDVGERFRFLDAVCLLDREGPTALQQLFGARSATLDEDSLQKAVSDQLFDWNEPLRAGNQWFDKQVAIYRMSDRKKRDAALERTHVDLEQMTTDARGTSLFALGWLAKKTVNTAQGKMAGASLLQLFDSDFSGILNVGDQLELHLAFTQAGMALAAYRAEHGEYPERMEELVPKYIAQLPRDLYGEHAALHYRRESSGYLLYSVGPNGRDEQGSESENFPDSDDISLFISDEHKSSTPKY